MFPSKKSLYEYLFDYARAEGEKPFLLDETEKISAKETLERVNALVTQMVKAGVDMDDKIAFAPVRKKESAIVLYALIAMGVVTLLCEPFESVEGYLKNHLSETKVDHILGWNGDELQLKTGEKVVSLDTNARKSSCPLPVRDVKKTSLVVFTSGSTGKTKGVRLSQYAFISCSEDTGPIGGYFPDDLNMELLPLTHVFGLSLIITAIVLRHAIFFPKTVEAKYLLQCIETYQITRMNCVPTLYLKMAEQNEIEKRDLSSLRYGLVGGASCTKAQFLEIEQGLSIKLVPIYGMTECMGISCGNYLDDVSLRSSGCGRVYSMNEVKIEEDGEICVKSPDLLNGYLGEKIKFGENVFFPTGDLGRIDENGILHVTGRKKEIIITNGNNLSIAEIEEKILSIDFVKDVCVVGIDDDTVGEIPVALVVLKEGGTKEGLQEALKAKLAKIERPKNVIFADQLPLTSSGKKDKQTVKTLFV